MRVARVHLRQLIFVTDEQVGTAFIRGVSGGERKRVNIGMELIISPGILFLDEPTTGLDSSTANTVMSILHRFTPFRTLNNARSTEVKKCYFQVSCFSR